MKPSQGRLRIDAAVRRVALGSFCYLEFFLLSVVFLLPLAWVALLTWGEPGRRLRGRWLRRLGRATDALNPLWHFRVEGPKPAGIDSRPFVVVANHQSSADPFLLALLPWDMRWVAKVELFRKPLVGWLLHLGGDIPLHRGESASVKAMMEQCRVTLAAGVSVMFFPEGTRSPDGRLQAFKDGAFRLAIETGTPVLPVVVQGTRACRPKGNLWFGEASAVAKVLEPIAVDGMTLDDVPRLKAQVRERIAEVLAVLEGRGAASAS
jgi:1-acyl-sn-glycerol-3-phosphate acyltransferase